MPGVEDDSPARVAGVEVAVVDLADRAPAVVGRGEGVGLLPEGDSSRLVGEPEDPAVVLDRQLGAAPDQFLLPEQA